MLNSLPFTNIIGNFPCMDIQTKAVEDFNTEFAKAVKRSGGNQKALGIICDRTQQAVSTWYDNKSIPKSCVKKIVAKFPGLSQLKLMGL